MEHQVLKYIYRAAEQPNAYTLLLLHGTGGNENDLLPLGDKFGKHINVLSVRGNVLEHGMPRFFKRLGMGIFDEKDLSFRTDELVAFLKSTAKKENFELSKIIALGYSNGANIAGSILVKYPELLAGAILFRPMQPYQQLPDFKSANRSPILLTSGKLDPTIDADTIVDYASILKKNGYQTTHLNLDTSHNLTQEDVKLGIDWFNQNFKNGNI